MKKYSVLISSAAILLFLAQCSPKGGGAAASKAETFDKSQYTAAQLDEGKTIWQNNCQKCHKLYEPSSHTMKQWERIIPRMAKKADLEATQADLVRAHILSSIAG